jgi:hypothetical protein
MHIGCLRGFHKENKDDAQKGHLAQKKQSSCGIIQFSDKLNFRSYPVRILKKQVTRSIAGLFAFLEIYGNRITTGYPVHS